MSFKILNSFLIVMSFFISWIYGLGILEGILLQPIAGAKGRQNYELPTVVIHLRKESVCSAMYSTTFLPKYHSHTTHS